MTGGWEARRAFGPSTHYRIQPLHMMISLVIIICALMFADDLILISTTKEGYKGLEILEINTENNGN